MGVTIDSISCICIVLSIGLCVDYSAHIAHTFGAAVGNSKECTHAALTDIGPAVLNGGITTLLALFVLAFSDYYFFIIFFKVKYV